MGRKKKYDRQNLTELAMGLFREHGFAGTSADMLVEHLGVNRYSIYAEFGSKQGLFEAALERYDDVVIGTSYGPLESANAGLAEIRALFEFYGAASETPGWGRGCLLCNTAIEFGRNDPSSAEFVQRYLERVSSAFGNALRNARERGELPATVGLEAEASFLTSSVLGIFVMMRATAPASMVEDAARVALEHLDALAKTGRDQTSR